ncbi:MAG: DUF58 domain-containing protein [Rhodobacteraceae bacterium]|nr:DUF58 domain-containing protein [Paracoccaceae bacterium]
MPAPPRTPDALLRRLEWTVIRRLDGLLHGAYRTLFRGTGLDLAGLREYQYGDDVRHIDWNVTARLQTPYVRQFNEDREVIGWFLLDLSPSVDFGGQVSKRDLAIEFVTVLTRILTRHGNPVGAIFYGDGVEQVIPPGNGRRHVLRMLRSLTDRPPRSQAKPTDLSDLIRTANQMMRRRAIAFLVSDFISVPGWAKPLAEMARRHETIAIRVGDQSEQFIPNIGLTVIQDAETGEQTLVDTSDIGFRRRYAVAADKREQDIRRAFGQAGVDALELATGDDLMDALLRFAALRKQRGTSTVGLPRHLEAMA